MNQRRFSALLIVIGWIFAVASTAQAQITFVFTYNDAAGVGFNDATEGAARKAALNAAANTLASYLTGYTATVTYSVSSTSNSSSGTLASAGSGISAVNGFQKSSIQEGIQNNTTTGTGVINWNFGYTWAYGDTVAGGAFDFKSVAMHELLHSFGFANFINSAGKGGFGNASGTPDVWTYYNQFLTTSNGTPLVDASFQFNTAGVGALLSDGKGGDVFFSGSNAMAANGGARVPIYSPASFISGSSLSHLDTDFYGTNDYIMTHAVTSGLSVRTLSAIELGILKDLGYNVAAIPEPASIAVFFGGAALMVGMVIRRRR